MHRAPALLRTARTCRSAIISTRPAGTRGSTIVTAWGVSTWTVTALARRPARTSIDRLPRSHRTGINRTPGNRARRTRRHPRTRRRRSTWRRRTLRQSRHHVGSGRHHRPCLRLPCQIRLGRRTQRLRGRGRRTRRSRPDGLRPQRRRKAGQVGSGRPRRTRRRHRSWRRHRRRSLRRIAHASRHRLSRTGKNLPGSGRRNGPRGNRRAARHTRNRRRSGSRRNRHRRRRGSMNNRRSHRRQRRGRRRDTRRRCVGQWNRWRRKTLSRRRLSTYGQWRTQRRRQPHRHRGNLLDSFRFGLFRRVLHHGSLGLRCERLRRRLHRGRFGRSFLAARNRSRGRAAYLSMHAMPDLQRHVVVERAGVRLLVGDAQLGQRLKNHVGFYFELAGQLIDANFTHTITFRRLKSCALERTDFHESSASPFTVSGEAAGTSVTSILSDSFTFSSDAANTGSVAAVSSCCSNCP